MTEPEDLTADQIDKEIYKKHTELLDMNSAIIQSSRQMAKDALVLKDAYLLQAEKCVEIAELHAIGARVTAELTGDLLSSEWNLEEVTEDDDDELFEDDDDD